MIHIADPPYLGSLQKKNSGIRVVLASAFGSFLEFFDHGIYNFYVIYFATTFFPVQENRHNALLLALGTYGAGFFMRPLGGIILGWYADYFGRRRAMIVTIVVMTMGTCMLGAAPPYASYGYLGMIMIITARLMQGFAAGGEIGASTVMLSESAPPCRRNFFTSWQLAAQYSSTAFAGMLALGISLYLPALVNDPNIIQNWGWRLPFFVGVLLGPLGCWLRLSLTENGYNPGETTKLKRHKSCNRKYNNEIFTLLRQNYSNLVIGLCLTTGGTVCTYITLFYYSTFAEFNLGISTEYSHASKLIGSSVAFFMCLVIGYLLDKVQIHIRKILFYPRILMLLCAYPSFWLLDHFRTPSILLTVTIFMTFLTVCCALPAIIVMTWIYPKKIRALSFSLIYSVAVAIFGGFAQYFSELFLLIFKSNTAPSFYLMFGITVSLLVVPYVKPYRKEEKKENVLSDGNLLLENAMIK